jgi:uncharacterized protein YegJ (DUF2314 family)
MRRCLVYLVVITAATAIILPGCTARKETGGKTEIHETVRLADTDDPELARIAEQAQETLAEFFTCLQRPRKGERDFMVKVPFTAEEGNGIYREYIWLRDIYFRDGLFYGTVANRPFYIDSLAIGSLASFDTDDIADWMYFRDGTIVGGRSVKYLIELTAEIDRSALHADLLNLFEQE